MIRAVFFDMDGTLIDSEIFWKSAYLELTGEAGIPASEAEAFYGDLIGATVDQCRSEIAAWLPDAVDAYLFLSRWQRRVMELEAGQVHLKPGARALVNTLRLRGLPMAVVTSSNRESALALLARADLLPAMSFVIAAEDAPRTKPDPAPYLLAAERIGVAIADCAIFEDSNTGTTAALASGGQVAQIPDLIAPTPALHAAGHIIAPTLAEAAKRLGLSESVSTAPAGC